MMLMTQAKVQCIAEKTGKHSAVVYMPASAGLEATVKMISWLQVKGCRINFVAATEQMSAVKCRQAITHSKREFEKGAGLELANVIYLRGPESLVSWLEGHRGAWCSPKSLSLKTERKIAQNVATWLLARQLDATFPEIDPLDGMPVIEIDNYYYVEPDLVYADH